MSIFGMKHMKQDKQRHLVYRQSCNVQKGILQHATSNLIMYNEGLGVTEYEMILAYI